MLMLVDTLTDEHAQAWKRLNAFGEYYVWGAFLAGFAKRVTLDSFYLMPVALLIVVLVVKVATLWRYRDVSSTHAVSV
jgi:hypothetical protein